MTGDPPPPQPNRFGPSTPGGWLYLGVLALTAVGIAVVVLGSWRLGVKMVAGALGMAALSRLVLTDVAAGMLKVRTKLLDAGLLTAMAAVIYFLAETIPNQP